MPISSIEDTLIEYWTNNIGNYGGESFEIDIVGNRKWERLLEDTECEYIDIANYIMLTIAAMKSENLIPSVSERQKEKVKRKLYEAGNRRKYRISRKS